MTMPVQNSTLFGIIAESFVFYSMPFYCAVLIIGAGYGVELAVGSVDGINYV